MPFDYKVAVLNSSIVTANGLFSRRTISVQRAKELVEGGFISYVGHPATCEILTSLLGVEVPMNRGQFSQEVGQKALVFKLNGRPAPGVELSKEELEEIGFSFFELTRLS